MTETRRIRPNSILLPVSLLMAIACASDDDLGGTVGDHNCSVPVEDSDQLREWLQTSSYSGWSSESAIHESSGPHFGNVRTWISPELEASLTSGGSEHPECATAVKELYGDSDVRLGWSLSMKWRTGMDASDWYWFESYEGKDYADGTGTEKCVGCHSAGIDFVRVTFPLP